MQVESYQREPIEGTIGAAPPTPPWHSSPAHKVLLAVDGSASGIPGARMEALMPSPAGALAVAAISSWRHAAEQLCIQRDYGFLQRVFWESIDSIAVPTTGIVLSILAGSLQSSSVR